MSKTDSPGIISYLAAARGQVEAAQEAVIAGDLLRAATCVREANALQQEAVALLLAGCWQNALRGASDGDPQHREEALAHVCDLASAVLGTLCSACREKMSDRLQAGEAP